jgi:seryl-tRNA(Sec) selenium transferase
MGRLPDSIGMKNEFVVLAAHDYIFSRCLTYPGGKLVKAGDLRGCTPDQLSAAIGPNTAAVEYWVGYLGDADIPTLEQTVEIAHRHDVPVIADAAAIVYPLDRFVTTARTADLACFGGKYMDGPNASGYVCGKKDLVDAVVGHGFVEFHLDGQGFGRAMKMDRHQIIALVAVVDAWLSTNHEDRLAAIEQRLVRMNEALSQLPVFNAPGSTRRRWGRPSPRSPRTSTRRTRASGSCPWTTTTSSSTSTRSTTARMRSSSNASPMR